MIKTYQVIALLILTCACTKQGNDNGAQTAVEERHEMMSPQRDISNSTLIQIDSAIQKYADAVSAAKNTYETDPIAGQAALVKALIDFGDYMQYESTVSPRQGKYHRALTEYRHALALDPANDKVLSEIQQIEDIYRSMGRPIPDNENL